jgi:hypothetical protein
VHDFPFIEETITADFEQERAEFHQESFDLPVEAKDAFLTVRVILGVKGVHLESELQGCDDGFCGGGGALGLIL